MVGPIKVPKRRVGYRCVWGGQVCIKCKFDKTDMRQRMVVGDGAWAKR
ncbi:MAG: hypothetical protein ACYS67_16240 [Planctomycetota bacterium]